jgi:hypothetical protein
MKFVSNCKGGGWFDIRLCLSRTHLFTAFPGLLRRVVGLDGIIGPLLLVFFTQFEELLLFERIPKSRAVFFRFAALPKCLFERRFEGLVVRRAPHFPASAKLGWTCVTEEAVD